MQYLNILAGSLETSHVSYLYDCHSLKCAPISNIIALRLATSLLPQITRICNVFEGVADLGDHLVFRYILPKHFLR